MKISIGQINIHPGQLSYNYNSMLLMIKKAIKSNYDLIVFPLYSISGLAIGEKWHNNSFVIDIEEYNRKVIALSNEIDIIFGSIKKQRDTLYSVAYYASKGKLKKNNAGMDYCIKQKSENEDIFFETSYFKYGVTKNYYLVDNLKIGLSLGNDYEIMDNCDITINLAHNAYLGNINKKIKGNLIYVNGCGSSNINNNIYLLKGNSFYAINNKIIYEADYFSEELCFIDGKKEVGKVNLFDVLVNSVREYDKQVHFSYEQYVVNYDGSKKAYANLAIMLKAVGKERVIVYNFTNQKVPFNCYVIELGKDSKEDSNILLLKSGKIIVSNAIMVDLGVNNFVIGDICPLASLKISELNSLMEYSNNLTKEEKTNEFHEYLFTNMIENENFMINLLKMYKNKLFFRSEIAYCIKKYQLENPRIFIDELLLFIKNFNKAQSRIYKAGKFVWVKQSRLWQETIKVEGYCDYSRDFDILKDEVLKGQ